MTELESREGLRAPELREAPSDFDATASPLALAGPTGSRPFLLVGGDMEVRGTERGGIDRVAVGGLDLLSGLRSDAGVGANFVMCPGMVRREAVGGRGSILESVLAVPGLRLLAVRWRPPPGGLTAWSLEVALTLLPDVPRVSRAVGPSGLRALVGASTERTVDLVFHPVPAELGVSDGGRGGLSVSARFAAAGPVTLLLSPGRPSEAPRVVTAAPHLQAHQLRGENDPHPGSSGTLVVETGVGEIDRGVGWATHRLHAALGAPGPRTSRPSSTEPFLWSGLGALAVGDAEGCLRAVQALRTHPEPPGLEAPPGSDGAFATLLGAGVTLLTGDPGPALAADRVLAGGAARGIRASTSPSGRPFWALALQWLADALRHATSEKRIAELLAAADGLGGAAGPLRLPMIGGPHDAAPAPAELVPWLLGPGASPVPMPGEGGHGGFVAAWARVRRGDTEGGYRAWRKALSAGLADGPSGRATWDPPGVPGAPEAASALACLGFGLLGLLPDAPSGRIRIAPSLPNHLRSLVVRRIRIGDARIDLEYRRDDGRHRFDFAPTEGRVPPVVVFAPTVAPEAAGAVRIDGRAADLTWSREDPRPRLQVQLSLDAPRCVEMSSTEAGRGA